MAVLDVQNLHVFYGQIHALHGVSLSVDQDEIVTLIGANGAGKTTTLGAISGVLPVAEGEVSLDGQPLDKIMPHDLVKMGIVQVPEGRRIFGRLTVEENLEMGAFVRTDKEGIVQSRERVLEMFPVLKERMGQVAGTLSGGEQQMLAMARGLMSKPRVLLLDEPSMGLAPMLVEQVFGAVQQVRDQGVPVLLVEQNAFMALQIADRGYVMETGEISLAGSNRELLENEDVKRAYLGLVGEEPLAATVTHGSPSGHARVQAPAALGFGEASWSLGRLLSWSVEPMDSRSSRE